MTTDAKTSKRWTESGHLYVVGTPIGNLSDWSTRAKEVLQEVDVILAEDTRVTGLLCHQFGISASLWAFHAHNTQSQIPQIVAALQSGKCLALVSDRGMPGVSDPGQELIDELWRQEIPVSVVPGPSASVTAFVASGFSAPFAFWGFLPRPHKMRGERLAQIKEWPHVSILYESPHHMAVTLRDLANLWDDPMIFVGRELTKRFEEYWRGRVSTLLEETSRVWRGEFVLVIDGGSSTEEDSIPEWQTLVDLAQELIARDMKPKDAIREIASRYPVNKRELYRRLQEVPFSKN